MPITKCNKEEYTIITPVEFDDGSHLSITFTDVDPVHRKVISDLGQVSIYVMKKYGINLEELKYQKVFFDNHLDNRNTFIKNGCIQSRSEWTDDVVIDIQNVENFVEDLICLCDSKPNLVDLSKYLSIFREVETMLKKDYHKYFYDSQNFIYGVIDKCGNLSIKIPLSIYRCYDENCTFPETYKDISLEFILDRKRYKEFWDK